MPNGSTVTKAACFGGAMTFAIMAGLSLTAALIYLYAARAASAVVPKYQEA